MEGKCIEDILRKQIVEKREVRKLDLAMKEERERTFGLEVKM